MRDGGIFLGALGTVAVAAVLLVCGAASCDLLWNSVVPLPQRMLLVALGGNWGNVSMIAQVIVGALPLGVSFALMRSTRMRVILVRFVSRDGKEECVKKARYLNTASPQKTRLLLPAVLGAALLIAAFELMTGWIRVMPNGSRVWATGAISVEPRWALMVALVACVIMVALYFLSVGEIRFALVAAAIGATAILAFDVLDCSPSALPFFFSLLFGLQVVGALFCVWGDEPRGLRVLACCELAPPLALAASVCERMSGLMVDGASSYGMPAVALLIAMDGCSILVLFIRAFVIRGRCARGTGGESKPSLSKRVVIDWLRLKGRIGFGMLLPHKEKCYIPPSSESTQAKLASYGLSERELFVLSESLRGGSLAYVAKELGVSRSTAGTYRLRAYAKMGVESLDEARAMFDAADASSVVGETSECEHTVSESASVMGLTAWLVLAQALLLPWTGSRVWLYDEAWSALPSVLLVLGSAGFISGGLVKSDNARRALILIAAICAALIVPMPVFLSGWTTAGAGFPVFFDLLVVLALAFSFEDMASLARHSRLGPMGCAVLAAVLVSIASAAEKWYVVVIAVSAVFLCGMLVKTARAERCGDRDSMPGAAHAGASRRIVETTGFLPHGDQAVCIIVGFSMLGWCFHRVNEVVILGLTAAENAASLLLPCALFLLVSSLVVMWNRSLRNLEFKPVVFPVVFIAVAWAVSIAGICGLGVLGCNADASPMGHLVIGFPAMVLAGVILDALLSFQVQHGCKSLEFAFPVIILVVLSVWCGGAVFADIARGFASQAVPVACVALGGALGLAGLGGAWDTLHKRVALGSADPGAIVDVLQAAGLTQAEARVALLLCGGMTVREVAEALCVECTTIRSHVRSVYAKLAVHTRSELDVAVAALAREQIR